MLFEAILKTAFAVSLLMSSNNLGETDPVKLTTKVVPESCPVLTSSQIKTLKMSYEYGEDNLGKGWGKVMVGIAHKESQFGKFVVNNKTQDYGVFQNHLKTVVKRNKIKYPVKAKKRLIRDFHYSADESRKEIEFWKKVHGEKNLKKILASYNAGYNYKGAAGQTYMKEVTKSIKLMQTCYGGLMM